MSFAHLFSGYQVPVHCQLQCIIGKLDPFREFCDTQLAACTTYIREGETGKVPARVVNVRKRFRSEMEAMGASLLTAKSDASKQENDMKSLKAQMEELKTQNEELKGTVAELKGTVDELRGTIQELEAEINIALPENDGGEALPENDEGEALPENEGQAGQ